MLYFNPQSAEQRGQNILTRIETELSDIEGKDYYSLASYNSCFKQKNHAEFVAHQARLFALRDRYEAGSTSYNTVNNLLVDLKNKCFDHWHSHVNPGPIIASSPAA